MNDWIVHGIDITDLITAAYFLFFASVACLASVAISLMVIASRMRK